LWFSPLVGSDGQISTSVTASKVINDAVACAPDPEAFNGAPPSSYVGVLRLAGCVQITRCVGDHTGENVVTYRPPASRDWASVTTPAVASPPAGFLGGFSVASGAALSASYTYYRNTLRVVAQLRNRA